MKSEHVNNKMLSYFFGELSEEEKKQVEHHLATCRECSSSYDKLKGTLSVIEAERKLEPTAYMYSKIQNKIALLKDTEEAIYRKPWLVQLLKPVYISVFIAFAVATGMLVGNNLNINSKNSSTKSSYSYTVNNTKDFYILGVDVENNSK